MEQLARNSNISRYNRHFQKKGIEVRLMQMTLLYYKCTFALFILCLHKLGIEAHAYAHYTSLLCFMSCILSR